MSNSLSQYIHADQLKQLASEALEELRNDNSKSGLPRTELFAEALSYAVFYKGMKNGAFEVSFWERVLAHLDEHFCDVGDIFLWIAGFAGTLSYYAQNRKLKRPKKGAGVLMWQDLIVRVCEAMTKA